MIKIILSPGTAWYLVLSNLGSREDIRLSRPLRRLPLVGLQAFHSSPMSFWDLGKRSSLLLSHPVNSGFVPGTFRVRDTGYL